MDFPFGPQGQTALDYFDEFMKGTETGSSLQRFVEAARRSRLGLHQDVLRTNKTAQLRELISGKELSTFPPILEYGKGEILLARAMTCDNQSFFFGNAKGFSKDREAVRRGGQLSRRSPQPHKNNRG